MQNAGRQHILPHRFVYKWSRAQPAAVSQRLRAPLVPDLSFLFIRPVSADSPCRAPHARTALVAAYTGTTLLVHHSPILFPWSLDTAFAGALFIYGGHLLAASQILNRLSAKSLLCAAVILPIYVWAVKSNGGSGGMYCREFGRLGWYAPVVFIVMGICGSYLWCIFCQILEKLRIVRLLSAIGEHTLLLLCSHMFIYLIVSMLAAACFSMWPTMQKLAPFVFIIQLFAALSFAFLWSRIKKTYRP